MSQQRSNSPWSVRSSWLHCSPSSIIHQSYIICFFWFGISSLGVSWGGKAASPKGLFTFSDNKPPVYLSTRFGNEMQTPSRAFYQHLTAVQHCSERAFRPLKGASELLFSMTWPSRSDLAVASSALTHFSADSRPPVGPPCPLFASSTPSTLHSHTLALSRAEAQHHGDHILKSILHCERILFI